MNMKPHKKGKQEKNGIQPKEKSTLRPAVGSDAYKVDQRMSETLLIIGIYCQNFYQPQRKSTYFMR